MTDKKGPVKTILILSANPIGTARLRLDEEVREIEEGLRRSKCRDQFEIHKKGAIRLDDLRRVLLDHEPQILHFTGHGEKAGLICEDIQGFATELSPEALSELLKLFANKIECVILSACYSINHAKAINKHIRYVIGMHAKIKDKAAIKFAIGFYDALGAGENVEKAFKFGKNAIRQYFPKSSEHSIPLLRINKKIPPKKPELKKNRRENKKEVPLSKNKPAGIRPIFLALIIIAVIVSVWVGKSIIESNMDNIKGDQSTARTRKASQEKSPRLNKQKPAKELIQEIFPENSFYKIASRQERGVTSLAASCQSRYLTGSPDGTVRLWDYRGHLLQTLPGHSGWVAAVAFSPDGKTILSSGNDGTVRLCTLKGKLIRAFKAHEEPVDDAAFSPDGRSILTGSTDKTARLWNLKGDLLNTFNGHYKSVTTVAFSPDGKLILTGSFDESVRVWDLNGKEEIISIETGKSVYSAAFSPSGKYIVTGLDDGIVRLWNMNGEELWAFSVHEEKIHSVIFSPDGKRILTGSEDKTACLLDLEGNEHYTFEGHEGSIYSAVFSHNGRWILTGSFDKTVRIWNTKAAFDFLNNKE